MFQFRMGFTGAFISLCLATIVTGQTNQGVYTDSLQNGWNNWSWAAVNFSNASPVHSGANSISVSSTNWQALYFSHVAQNGSFFTNLTFWVNGGPTGGQIVTLQATRNTAPQAVVQLPPLPINGWRQETVSLASLGVATASDFDGFWLQVQSAGLAPTFYVDDLTLVGGSPPPPVTNAPLAITVDAALNRHPISPLIYGVAFASSNQLAGLNSPLNRSGGNSETRYNWQLNAHNHAADWYYESIADGTTVAGAAADDLVSASKSAGSEPILTVPMIGWAAKLGANRGKLSSYSIAKYGPQTGSDSQWFADAGNGISSTNSKPITSNDPNDANVATDSTFQQNWIKHLTNQWGLSTNGGVRYYCMDNEHTIWHSTHQDIHPVGTTMREIRDKFFDYAAKVKAVDPGALVLAPEEWGWSGYLYSGYDQQWSGAHGDYNSAHYPDRTTNDGWDYLPWFLDQARQRATNTNQRLLDFFTVHYYPQGGEFGNDTSTAMQLLRNQSTRSLWDSNYGDQSWIAQTVKLIPRLRNWATSYYPGTKIGITEYNWGAESHINGATAQADILGIFGREGLDLATRWTAPDSSTPVYNAIQLYRNYDGHKSTFGDTSVFASSPNPDNMAVFGAIRSSDSALTLMLINKQLTGTQPATLTLTNFMGSGSVQAWQLTASNAIVRLKDTVLTGNTFTNSFPSQSLTLLVFTVGNPPHLRTGRASSTNVVDLWLDGLTGQRYVIQTSSNLQNWVPFQTITLTSNSLHLLLPLTNGFQHFYRGQWNP